MTRKDLLKTLDAAIAAESNIATKFLLKYCREYIEAH